MHAKRAKDVSIGVRGRKAPAVGHVEETTTDGVKSRLKDDEPVITRDCALEAVDETYAECPADGEGYGGTGNDGIILGAPGAAADLEV